MRRRLYLMRHGAVAYFDAAGRPVAPDEGARQGREDEPDPDEGEPPPATSTCRRDPCRPLHGLRWNEQRRLVPQDPAVQVAQLARRQRAQLLVQEAAQLLVAA